MFVSEPNSLVDDLDIVVVDVNPVVLEGGSADAPDPTIFTITLPFSITLPMPPTLPFTITITYAEEALAE
ncbi:MAG TPA: hypothetical protein VE826_07450 [Dongiaceae bacterium]|nr:hypothetical protein [Dongiaceae bacterium]